MNTKIEEALEYYKQGEYDKAIDIFSSVIETEEPTAELYNNIGQCYSSIANDTKAEENFLKAIELNPKKQRYEAVPRDVETGNKLSRWQIRRMFR